MTSRERRVYNRLPSLLRVLFLVCLDVRDAAAFIFTGRAW